jgi:hypothetical protein
MRGRKLGGGRCKWGNRRRDRAHLDFTTNHHNTLGVYVQHIEVPWVNEIAGETWDGW